MKTSVTEENYLKAIYKLSEMATPVATTDIANALNIKSATVTDMLKKLARKNDVEVWEWRTLLYRESGLGATDLVLPSPATAVNHEVLSLHLPPEADPPGARSWPRLNKNIGRDDPAGDRSHFSNVRLQPASMQSIGSVASY